MNLVMFNGRCRENAYHLKEELSSGWHYKKRENVNLIIVRGGYDWNVETLPSNDPPNCIMHSLRLKYTLKDEIQERVKDIMKDDNYAILTYPCDLHKGNAPASMIYWNIKEDLFDNNVVSINNVYVINEIKEDKYFNILDYYIKKAFKKEYTFV